MSTQNFKKGFTLIELMVVIVIIGILAAIAIPKLFGMSAKAKAQEVGPAAGTYVKLQQAYIMEKGPGPGSTDDIGYVLPGTITGTTGATSNFDYTATAAGLWTATVGARTWLPTSDCTASNGGTVGTWTLTVTDTNSPTAVKSGCAHLTPNFDSFAKN